MALQKKWETVPNKGLIADGDQFGVVSVSDTYGFFPGQKVFMGGNAPLTVQQFQVKKVTSSTTLIVGPVDGKVVNETNFTRSDVSAYTVILNSYIGAEEQDKSVRTDGDIFEAVYERSPVVALRNLMVDTAGRPYSNANPLPINFSGTINVLGSQDKSAFAYGVDKEMPVGGVYNDSTPTLVSGTTGAVRLTQYRAFHTNLRDSAGNEITSSLISGKRGLDVNLIDANLEIGTVEQGDPSALGATGAWYQKITDGTNVAAVSAASALKVDGSAVTQPISATALPLPALAATSTKQSDGSQKTQIVDPSGNAITSQASGAQKALDVGVNVAGVQVDPRAIRALTSADIVTAAQGASATNANGWFTKITDGTNNALVSSSGGLIIAGLTAVGIAPANNPVSVSGIDGGGLKRHILTDITGRVQVSASTVDASGAAKIGGKSSVTLVRNDYSSVNVTTAAYTQLIASTSALVTEIEIFDSSGQTLVLAFGAAASEVNQIYIFPGGNGRVPLYIPAGTRLSIKAISATANQGEIDINLYA